MLNRRQIWRKVQSHQKIESINNLFFDEIFKTKKNNKRVNFSNEVSVILIPSIEDYRKNKLIDDLWYNYEEIKDFYLKNNSVL
jgi:hypothetical protein